jgi:hypothetical protein
MRMPAEQIRAVLQDQLEGQGEDHSSQGWAVSDKAGQARLRVR